MRRTARQRSNREAAGVAIAIEHALQLQATRVIGKLLATVALVQVKARLVALSHIERQLPIVLAQHHTRVTITAQPTRYFRQTFELAHV